MRAMKADEPFLRTDHDHIEHTLRTGRGERGRQSWERRGGAERGLGGVRFRREAGLVAMLAHGTRIARPDVQMLEPLFPGKSPSGGRQRLRRLAGHASQREPVGASEDRFQQKIVGQPVLGRQLERDKAGTRVGETKRRPPPRQLPLHRLFGRRPDR